MQLMSSQLCSISHDDWTFALSVRSVLDPASEGYHLALLLKVASWTPNHLPLVISRTINGVIEINSRMLEEICIRLICRTAPVLHTAHLSCQEAHPTPTLQSLLQSPIPIFDTAGTPGVFVSTIRIRT